MNAAPLQWLMATLLIVLASAGCHSAQPIEDTGPSPMIIARSEPAGSVHAASAFAAEANVQNFILSGSDDDGAFVRRETSSSTRFKAQWITVESIITDDGPMARQTEFWSVNDHGDVLLHASIDHRENALTLFNPPLLIMPAELTAGETREIESSMRVVAADNPARSKERGSATQTITYVSNAAVRTPIGELNAAQIVIEFTADLSMADAVERTERYINADHGIIAERRTRRVNVLGMPGTTHEETLLRNTSQ